ncbi:unnamed protein product [Linum trigynum]|uniref:Uncharacterized protein n=1 Tax=Linum trigynum TaxID=586398 RepID=A0AAV2GSW0_9ROSI
MPKSHTAVWETHCGRVRARQKPHGQPGHSHGRVSRGRVGSLKSLNETPRFAKPHGQLGESHGRVTWPGESGFSGFKPISSHK